MNEISPKEAGLLRPRADARLDEAIARASESLVALQHPDGHWLFELEADVTIPAEFILLQHYLGRIEPGLQVDIADYIRATQGADGGWPLFYRGAFDLSASVKAYFALKAAGDPVDAPHMARARTAILAAGGARRSNVFTRILLALWGEVPWHAVPTMPVEMLLLPAWFPFHIDKISYWSRVVVVPLTVLMAKQPRAKNPRGVSIGDLFVEPLDTVSDWIAPPTPSVAGKTFVTLDKVVRAVEPYFPKKRRQRAIDKAVDFVTERLNGEDGLGGIFPAMANSLMMYVALGYPLDHPLCLTASGAVDKLVTRYNGSAYCQPCLSPVWDTVLAGHALMDVDGATVTPALTRAFDWLAAKQVCDVVGD